MDLLQPFKSWAKTGSKDVNGLVLSKMLGLTTAGILDVAMLEATGFSLVEAREMAHAVSVNTVQTCSPSADGASIKFFLQITIKNSSGKLQLDYLDRYRPNLMQCQEIK